MRKIYGDNPALGKGETIEDLNIKTKMKVDLVISHVLKDSCYGIMFILQENVLTIMSSKVSLTHVKGQIDLGLIPAPVLALRLQVSYISSLSCIFFILNKMIICNS